VETLIVDREGIDRHGSCPALLRIPHDGSGERETCDVERAFGRIALGIEPSTGGTMEKVEIKARENGPYRVAGPVRVIDSEGNEYDLGGRGEVIALCRCGASTTKPFCDGTHSKIGFDAAERAVAESEA